MTGRSLGYTNLRYTSATPKPASAAPSIVSSFSSVADGRLRGATPLARLLRLLSATIKCKTAVCLTATKPLHLIKRAKIKDAALYQTVIAAIAIRYWRSGRHPRNILLKAAFTQQKTEPR